MSNYLKMSSCLKTYCRIAVLLIFFGVLVLVTTDITAQTVKNPNTAVVARVYAIESLDPAYAYVGFEPLQNIYETLIAYKPESSSEFIPCLASKVPSLENKLISEDGLTYTFPIRKGIKFHNGAELTPRDVEYSFERAMVSDPAGGPTWMIVKALLGVGSTLGKEGFQVTFDQIDKAVKVDGENVVFRLPAPAPYFLQIIPFAWCSILSKSWVISQGGWPGTEDTWKKFNNVKKEESTLFDKANGTGPFKLERWDKANEIVLARNNNYWGPPAKLEKVVRKVTPEWSTRMLLLKQGDVDIADVPREYLPQVRELKGVRIIDNLPDLVTYSAYFNQKIDPKGNPYIGSGELDGNGIPPDFFTHVNIRKAFNYAFDWNAYIKDAFDGAAFQTKGPIPKEVPYYNPDQETYQYNPDKAKELLKQVYNGELWNKGFKLRFPYISGVTEYKTVVDILRGNLAALNPKFVIEPIALQAPALFDAWNKNWMPLRVGYWRNDYPDPDNNVFALMHSTGYYAKAQGFSKYDQLVDEGSQTNNLAKRKSVYFQLQKMAFEDAIDIFLVQTTGWFVSREWVKGWERYSPLWARNDYFYPMFKE